MLVQLGLLGGGGFALFDLLGERDLLVLFGFTRGLFTVCLGFRRRCFALLFGFGGILGGFDGSEAPLFRFARRLSFAFLGLARRLSALFLGHHLAHLDLFGLPLFLELFGRIAGVELLLDVDLEHVLQVFVRELLRVLAHPVDDGEVTVDARVEPRRAPFAPADERGLRQLLFGRVEVHLQVVDFHRCRGELLGLCITPRGGGRRGRALRGKSPEVQGSYDQAHAHC